jgi:hypothetical protein
MIAATPRCTPLTGRRPPHRPETIAPGKPPRRIAVRQRPRVRPAGVMVVGRAEMGLRIAENNPQLEVHIFEDCWLAVDLARARARERGLDTRVHIRHAAAMRIVSRRLRSAV